MCLKKKGNIFFFDKYNFEFFLIFTPSQSTGSKYSTSVIAHCSHIRRNISIGVDDGCTLDIVSIDVRCRVLKKTENLLLKKNFNFNKYRMIAITDRCLF
jgi:hypothetical protein